MEPNHSVLNRFRSRLIADGLMEERLAELDRHLDAAGVILRRGTMLDATVIEAVSVPPRKGRVSPDPDARFIRRQGKAGCSFGDKAHVGVDEGSGLIRSVLTTPADVNDTTRPTSGSAARSRWFGPVRPTIPMPGGAPAEGERRHCPAGPPAQHAPSRSAAAAQALQSPARPAPVEITFATLKNRRG